MTFPTFDKWKSGDQALATLKAIYDVMAKAAPHYSHEPWRDMTPDHHMRKGFLHAVRSFTDLGSREDGKGANTGYPDWMHLLTRISFIAQLTRPYAEPKGVIVDTREQELANE